ncbi:MAG TPA: hypothetical protein RMG48_15585 [Myxococcales bacterium LLY-WYZ-16_1]|jgi:hypothetical protein|nr:hypothetical protein [Myxococcales bacterium LLY-WYZ-16_1]
MSGFDRMFHLTVSVYAINVPAALLLNAHIAFFMEVGHDSLNRPLRDADFGSNFSQANIRTPGKAKEHVTVVGQETPF